MKILRALVIANRKKQIAVKVKSQVQKFLAKSKVKISKNPQLVITVGGDGTVLCSKKHYGIPFFAIGSSTSFICQASFSNWKKKLSKVLQGFKKEKRLLLKCAVDGKKMQLALNEVGIRNPEPRVLSLHLACGKKHYAFRADGILFSTPTGSPAYCYSCGGKEMKKTENKYQAVSISPFRRLFTYKILSNKTKCILRFSGHEKAQLFIDGQPCRQISEKNTLRVKASKKPFYFAKA